MRQLLNQRLVDMDLSVRALNCLKAAEVDTLGELVKYHGDQAVVHVPDGVVRIGEGAFTKPVTFLGYGGPPPMCSWGGMETSETNVGTHEELCGFEFIREVYLPASVEAIGAHAFQSCVNLECIHLPGRLRSIGTHAFARCHSPTGGP